MNRSDVVLVVVCLLVLAYSAWMRRAALRATGKLGKLAQEGADRLFPPSVSQKPPKGDRLPLQIYGVHLLGCEIVVGRPCSCGFAEALEADRG